jgi:hypothetical protein
MMVFPVYEDKENNQRESNIIQGASVDSIL